MIPPLPYYSLISILSKSKVVVVVVTFKHFLQKHILVAGERSLKIPYSTIAVKLKNSNTIVTMYLLVTHDPNTNMLKKSHEGTYWEN